MTVAVPGTGKVLSVLVHGMQDRNVTVRRCSAAACGNVCRAAKSSSVEKLIAKLRTWYMEGEGAYNGLPSNNNLCLVCRISFVISIPLCTKACHFASRSVCGQCVCGVFETRACGRSVPRPCSPSVSPQSVCMWRVSDESLRPICAEALQSLSQHASSQLKEHAADAASLAFFAMHRQKTPGGCAGEALRY